MPKTRHFTDPKFDTTRQLYDYIEKTMQQGKSAPTLAEMGTAIHMSPAGVIRHLARLEAWGWIERQHGRPRGIELLRRRKEDAPENA